MIQIRVRTEQEPQRCVRELCEALKRARVWKMSDRRCTRNVTLQHSSGTVSGTVHRVNPGARGDLQFECEAASPVQGAITAGRFVNLVLRDMTAVSQVTILMN
jgi:hypothetical protein